MHTRGLHGWGFVQVTYQGTEALVSLEMVLDGPAAGDGHHLVIVADADVVALKLLLLCLGQLLQRLPADARRGLAGGRARVEERAQPAHLRSGGDGAGAGGGDGVGLPEQLERDMAGEGGPPLRVEGAEARQAGGERGVVAAAHAEPDSHVILVRVLG